MSTEKALKSEDRIQEIKGIDPVEVLERQGFDNYAIDHEHKIVYIPQNTLRKLANFFAKDVYNEAVGFIAYGWTWKMFNDCPDNCPQELCSGNPYHRKCYCELKEGWL